MKFTNLRKVMEQKGLDAIVVLSPYNRRYLSGFTGTSGSLLITQDTKQLITDFNNSDMTLSEWCDLNHVGKSTYYKYLRLIRNDLLNEQSSPVKIESKRLFVPVNVDVSKSEPLTITKGNVRIELIERS